MLLASNRNLPKGSTAAAVGCAPPWKGDPGTGVRPPVLGSTEKTEMFPIVKLTPMLFAT